MFSRQNPAHASSNHKRVPRIAWSGNARIYRMTRKTIRRGAFDRKRSSRRIVRSSQKCLARRVWAGADAKSGVATSPPGSTRLSPVGRASGSDGPPDDPPSRKLRRQRYADARKKATHAGLSRSTGSLSPRPRLPNQPQPRLPNQPQPRLPN